MEGAEPEVEDEGYPRRRARLDAQEWSLIAEGEEGEERIAEAQLALVGNAPLVAEETRELCQLLRVVGALLCGAWLYGSVTKKGASCSWL